MICKICDRHCCDIWAALHTANAIGIGKAGYAEALQRYALASATCARNAVDWRARALAAEAKLAALGETSDLPGPAGRDKLQA